jgi:hypothetical protein
MDEQQIRDRLVVVMKRMNNDRCRGKARFNYPYHTKDREYRMPASHWEPARANPKKPGQSESMNFSTKQGIKPSDAIEALFEGTDCPILIECLTAMYIVYYKALVECFGAEKFDMIFRDGIRVAPNRSRVQDYLTVGCRNNPGELKRGDWVYFFNHPNYLRRHPNSLGNAWQGENALVVGSDKYEGFGVSERSAEEITRELFQQYNMAPTRYDSQKDQYVPDEASDKAQPPLKEIREIPGLTAPRGSCKGKIGPVIIPNMDALR